MMEEGANCPVLPNPNAAACPVELRPMAEWVEEEDLDGVCRPCLLGPVIQWYQDELTESGYGGLASELGDLVQKEQATPLTLSERLDTIKDEVREALRERLMEFDCFAQAYKPTAEELEQQDSD